MQYVNDLHKIVALALCSAYVAGDKPLSLLIISDRPESGKTEIVKRFSGTPKVAFASDISGFGIKRDFADKIMKGEINHIIIPEFLQPLMKGKVSAQSFTTTLQVVMEDGIMGLHTGFLNQKIMNPNKPVKSVGIIGCMPRPYFTKSLKYEWARTGFLSRWLLVTYRYDSNAVESIIESIKRGDYILSKPSAIKIDTLTIKVQIPEDVADSCAKIGMGIVKEAREAGLAYGFREIKHIRSLVAANVIYDRVINGNDRTIANASDFNEIDRLGYLFNDQFNAVKQ